VSADALPRAPRTAGALGRYAPFLVLLLLVIGVQQAAHWAGKGFFLTPLTMSTYYALAVLGLCLLMGYAGQVSLGHAAFFAIGGYTAARLTTLNLAAQAETWPVRVLRSLHLTLASQDVYGDPTLAIHPWAAAAAALLVAGIIAQLIGASVLRLRGHYLAMATLGFGSIIHTLVKALESLGGADGISNVPGLPLFGDLAVGSDLKQKVVNYYVAWAFVIVGLLLLTNLVHSRVGRALRAIHGSEDAAEAVGVDAARYKRRTFVLSALFAAAAGVFLTHYNGGIGPSETSVMKSVRYVAIVAVGGTANLWGVLTMALILNVLSLRGYFGSYDNAVFGVILVVVMILAAQGRSVAGLLARLVPGRWFGR
jgi:branched-chain amino acid transport system permease protein